MGGLQKKHLLYFYLKKEKCGPKVPNFVWGDTVGFLQRNIFAKEGRCLCSKENKWGWVFFVLFFLVVVCFFEAESLRPPVLCDWNAFFDGWTAGWLSTVES